MLSERYRWNNMLFWLARMRGLFILEDGFVDQSGSSPPLVYHAPLLEVFRIFKIGLGRVEDARAL